MNKTLEAKTISEATFSEKIKKVELLQLIKMLDPRCSPPAAGKNSRKNTSAELKKESARDRQSQATCALLRKYFILRIAQCRGYAGEESF